MICVRLMGGLGNQMFQCAYARNLSIKNNTELFIDTTLLDDRTLPNEIVTHREFSLDIFNLQQFFFADSHLIHFFNGNPQADIFQKILYKIRRKLKPANLIIQKNNLFIPGYLLVKNNSCVVGRWQSESFFEENKNSIREEFKIKKEYITSGITEYARKISQQNSVCIHFRRTDLVTSPKYSKELGTIELDYYINAINLIKKKSGKDCGFFVFSDDVEWCKNNLCFDFPFEIVPESLAGKNAGGHLYLMTKCRHFIISNSTFAWWGAWLAESNDKIVIAPKKWYNEAFRENKILLPANWTAI